jgi:hypothetical protein
MADALRIVELDPLRGGVIPILDLQDAAGGIYTLRDTFRITGVTPTLATAASSRARRAPRPFGRTDAGRQVAGTWRIKGSSESDCLLRLEELLSRIGAAAPGRHLEWRPTGHPATTLMELLGPASWSGAYRAIELDQAHAISAEITFPVDVDARGLPWHVYDDFLVNPLTSGDWLTVIDELSLTWLGQRALQPEFPGGTTTGSRSVIVHRGRNTPHVVADRVVVTFTPDSPLHICPIISYVDQNNYVYAENFTGQIQLRFRVGGNDTFASAVGSAASLTDGIVYALEILRNGPRAWEARLFHQGQADPMGAANEGGRIAYVAPDDATGNAVAAAFAAGGDAGILCLRSTAGSVGGQQLVHSFRRDPLTYRRANAGSAGSFGPRSIIVDELPGTVDGPPQEVDLALQPGRRGGGNAVNFGLVAWADYQRENFLENPDARHPQADGANEAFGWSATGAATISNGAVPYAARELLFAASAGDGVRYARNGGAHLWAEIHRGLPYTLAVDLRRDTAGSDVNVELRLGDLDGTLDWNGDGAATTTPVFATKTVAVGFAAGFIRHYITVIPGFDAHGIDLAILVAGGGGGPHNLRVRNAKLYQGVQADDPLIPDAGGYRPLGSIVGAGYHRADAGTITVDTTLTSTSHTASASVVAPTTALDGANDRLLRYVVDPRLITPPPFGRPLVIEVFAELDVPATWLTPVLRISARPYDIHSGPVQHAAPHGAAGLPLVPPTAGTVRRAYKLGVLTFEQRDRGRVELELALAGGAGSTGDVKVHRLFLAPVHARVSLPTGRQPGATYPAFLPAMPATLQEEFARILHPDLGSTLEGEITGARYRTSSMAGEPIALPAGRPVVVAAWLTEDVPNDPTSDAHTGGPNSVHRYGLAHHLRVTPRYNLAALLEA